MGRVAKASTNRPKRPQRPATTPKQREDQLIVMAYQAAEQQIADGSASSQIITHFLKLGSAREELERKKLEAEIVLRRAQADQVESAERQEALYAEAIKAMRTYQGEVQDD